MGLLLTKLFPILNLYYVHIIVCMCLEKMGVVDKEGRVMGLGKRVHEGVKACKPLIKMGNRKFFLGPQAVNVSCKKKKKSVA